MSGKYRVHELGRFRYSDIGEYVDEYHTDRPLRNDILVELLNKQDKRIKELEEENEQLKKDLKKKFVPFAKSDGDCITVNTEEFIKILNENEQLKQSNQKAIGLIYDGIVEMHDGKRDYAEKLFNKAIELIKW